MGEFDLIAWIRARSFASGRTTLGIGDDCASLRFPANAEIVVTTDMLMDGRHFRLGEATAEQVGYKALAVNLSDIAAMACIPVAALLAVALPSAEAVEIARGLHSGMRSLADRFGVSLIGGDTNAWDGPLVVSVTLLGEATEGPPIRRSGAKPGDAILVTGPLGGSLLGRHLHPEPRINEALALRRLVELHAMIDVSDGLASDLGHVLVESGGLGALLDARSIPVHTDAILLSGQDERPPLDHALTDGEDFELCVVVSMQEATRLLADPPCTLFRVGRVTAKPGLNIERADGRIEPLLIKGFDHLAGGPSF